MITINNKVIYIELLHKSNKYFTVHGHKVQTNNIQVAKVNDNRQIGEF